VTISAGNDQSLHGGIGAQSQGDRPRQDQNSRESQRSREAKRIEKPAFAGEMRTRRGVNRYEFASPIFGSSGFHGVHVSLVA